MRSLEDIRFQLDIDDASMPDDLRSIFSLNFIYISKSLRNVLN